jgi:probable rRNA maturation factor
MTHDYTVDVQYAASHTDMTALPTQQEIENWVIETCKPFLQTAEVSVRIVDNAEMMALNQRYRQKPDPTNVLSFPASLPAGCDYPLLGDIVLAASVITQEALKQHKSPISHWAHMVIHGTLHLLGFDHETDIAATQMEALEIKILQYFDFKNPYLAPIDMTHQGSIAHNASS